MTHDIAIIAALLTAYRAADEQAQALFSEEYGPQPIEWYVPAAQRQGLLAALLSRAMGLAISAAEEADIRENVSEYSGSAWAAKGRIEHDYAAKGPASLARPAGIITSAISFVAAITGEDTIATLAAETCKAFGEREDVLTPDAARRAPMAFIAAFLGRIVPQED